MRESQFVSVEEAAEFLGMSYAGVWRALQRGDFPVAAFQLGTKWRISRPGLEALVAGHTRPSPNVVRNAGAPAAGPRR